MIPMIAQLSATQSVKTLSHFSYSCSPIFSVLLPSGQPTTDCIAAEIKARANRKETYALCEMLNKKGSAYIATFCQRRELSSKTGAIQAATCRLWAIHIRKRFCDNLVTSFYRYSMIRSGTDLPADGLTRC